MKLIHAPDAFTVFEAEYARQVAAEKWKPRTLDEINRLIQNQYFLMKDNDILAGVSISSIQNIAVEQVAFHGRLIECLWRHECGVGHKIGLSTIQKVQAKFKDASLFAFSKNGVFSHAGFSPIEGILSSTGAQLYTFNPNF